jgi:hypothetical protein
MHKLDSPRLTLALMLCGLASACAPSGGSPSGPPPDAGADPTGSWQVQLLLNAIAGQCSGTVVQNEFWTFVPDGANQWEIEVQDFGGLTLGTLQARQQGLELLVTGQLIVSGGVTVRDYQSSGLYATPTALSGHMNLTRTGSINCAQWGPLTGVPTTAPLTQAEGAEPLEGVLRSANGSSSAARLLELEPGLFQLVFEHSGSLVLSPPLPLAEGGSLSAEFQPAGSELAYRLEARLADGSHLLGQLSASPLGRESAGWRATLSLERASLPLPLQGLSR